MQQFLFIWPLHYWNCCWPYPKRQHVRRTLKHGTDRVSNQPPAAGALGAALAGQVLDYYQRNRDFLQATEARRGTEFYTTAFQRQALEQDEKDAAAGQSRRFWLARNGEDSLIGNVALNNIVMGAFCSAFLSYRLDEAHVNQGLMTEAVTKLIAIAFREWGCTGWRPTSCRAIRHRCGWWTSWASAARGWAGNT